jgi:hypothetical protein
MIKLPLLPGLELDPPLLAADDEWQETNQADWPGPANPVVTATIGAAAVL